jgi:branched-chain amino acid transport system ATP-binding protein
MMLTDPGSRDNLTVVLVDQEIRQALKIIHDAYTTELGRIKVDGPASGFDGPEMVFWIS